MRAEAKCSTVTLSSPRDQSRPISASTGANSPKQTSSTGYTAKAWPMARWAAGSSKRMQCARRLAPSSPRAMRWGANNDGWETICSAAAGTGRVRRLPRRRGGSSVCSSAMAWLMVIPPATRSRSQATSIMSRSE